MVFLQVVLHRIGAHWWIPLQVILWGLSEVLHSQIKGVGGYYTARLFLGREYTVFPDAETQR